MPNVKTRRIMVHRFHMDCPIHGIKVIEGTDRSVPLTDEIVVDNNLTSREKRQRARKAAKEKSDARHSDVPRSGL